MEEESTDLDTSSDEAEDDNEIAEENDCTDATTSSQENKQVMVEQNCVERGENEKKTSGEEKTQSKKPPQPVIFVPVNRSPEIQVCAYAWSSYLRFLTATQRVHSYQRDCIILAVGGSTQAARAVRGAGHHGGGARKSLCRHMWGDRKWKNHPSPSVSV